MKWRKNSHCLVCFLYVGLSPFHSWVRSLTTSSWTCQVHCFVTDTENQQLLVKQHLAAVENLQWFFLLENNRFVHAGTLQQHKDTCQTGGWLTVMQSAVTYQTTLSSCCQEEESAVHIWETKVCKKGRQWNAEYLQVSQPNVKIFPHSGRRRGEVQMVNRNDWIIHQKRQTVTTQYQRHCRIKWENQGLKNLVQVRRQTSSKTNKNVNTYADDEQNCTREKEEIRHSVINCLIK